MLLLIIFAFLAGIVTVLSPCILPLLPIILSSADRSGKQKPVGVVLGFVASFTFFTLFLSSLVRWSGVSADWLRFLAVLVLAGFGASLVIPKLQAQVEVWFSRLTNFLPANRNRTGLVGGLIIGLSLGLLWTPCVGPILAAVISLAISGTVTLQAVLITLAYASGTAIPMLIIMLAGSQALKKVPWLVKNTARIQRAFGVMMILTALALIFNFDRKLQTAVVKTFPNYGVGLTKIEDNASVKQALSQVSQKPLDAKVIGKTMNELALPKGPVAPELIAGGEWFNSPPLSLADLKGKVVLIDFWTYSCINCQRTLPYLKSWWQKYQTQGLVIIGVHSPEFEFEKNPANVKSALTDFGLTYPVMQDNQFMTWRAYHNNYWPAKYLIDKDGYIRYTHYGEGDYDATERMIQTLLQEAGVSELDQSITNPVAPTYARTPESYLGYDRIEFLASPEPILRDQATIFSLPKTQPANTFAYAGRWTVMAEYAVPSLGAQLQLKFNAQDVYLVARPKSGVGTMKVEVDGQVQALGSDSKAGVVTVDSDRLYHLVHLASPGAHQLKIEFSDDQIEVYAFTFG